MELSLEILRQQFDYLISGDMSREEASSWALVVRQAIDADQIELDSNSPRDQVLKAVLFLEGVDMKDGPDSYLHNAEDISRERP